jgi:hypothetical protein
VSTAVIAREGGRTSTPRLIGSITTSLEYWFPAFAGMTADDEAAVFGLSEQLTPIPRHD